MCGIRCSDLLTDIRYGGDFEHVCVLMIVIFIHEDVTLLSGSNCDVYIDIYIHIFI